MTDPLKPQRQAAEAADKAVQAANRAAQEAWLAYAVAARLIQAQR